MSALPSMLPALPQSRLTLDDARSKLSGWHFAKESLSGDEGLRIPLTSRRAEGLMPFPVTDRRATVAANPSLLTAGADEAEADTPDGVAADPSVIDAERDPLYRDGVQHVTTCDSECCTGNGCDCSEREASRQSRLSRWQEQR